MALVSLPTLDKHVAQARGQDVLFAVRGVWADQNHRRALAMSSAMMFAAFTVIPYITIYMQSNQVLLPTEIPFIYLSGGVVTLLSARWIGILTDRVGKRKMFQRMLLLSMVPMTITTLMQPLPLPVVLLVSSALFFFMNARMIPGMALLTSAAQPQFRGAFMSLNGAVQSMSIGLATWIGGLLIQRNPQGQVTHYWLCALVGVSASLLAYALAQRVKMHTSEPGHVAA
jgi:predicted MFS family arabinose efflux permease